MMAVPFLVPAAITIASEFFPVLATKLGGTRGRQAAEQVIQVAATVAGTPRDADPRDIIAALKQDEGKAAEVRLRLEELDQEEHEKIIEDRMDARRYQASIGGRARLRGTMMLLGVIAGLVACIVAVFQSDDAGPLALLTTIAGALLKMLSDAFAFEFGSSSGSKEKDAQIESIQKAMIDTVQARNARDETERDEAQAMIARPPLASVVTLTPGEGDGEGSGETTTVTNDDHHRTAARLRGRAHGNERLTRAPPSGPTTQLGGARPRMDTLARSAGAAGIGELTDALRRRRTPELRRSYPGAFDPPVRADYPVG